MLILLLVSLVFSTSVKTVSITDGDTLTVLQDNTQIKIRIDAIDAPEKGMPFYSQSKKYLSDLCFQKNVTIKPLKKDRYGRLVARVILPDGRDVSAEMIKAGMAWHYKKYSKDLKLAKLELKARQDKIGLWSDGRCKAPWDVRTERRNMHKKKQTH
jgi:micrococcal nuclease